MNYKMNPLCIDIYYWFSPSLISFMSGEPKLIHERHLSPTSWIRAAYSTSPNPSYDSAFSHTILFRQFCFWIKMTY